MAGMENNGKGRGVFPINLRSDELHLKLGGGVPKGSVVFIEGMEGSGRSVISQRLAYGFLNNGASVTFISTEMTIKEFIDQMYSLEYKIGPYLLKEKLRYVPVYPLLSDSRPREDFLQKLVSSSSLWETDVLIVDSFSSLVKKELEPKQTVELLSFLKKVVKMDKSVILTAESGIPGLEPLRLASDIYLYLNMKSSGGSLVREIHVKRFLRARGQVDDIMKYRVEPRSGLVIEITDVAG
ncbi:MAG: AAA family ATPase [Methanomassiliicoccales archaeon]|nr:MAG: AAA family ATPase [Methanomassiliicoccales archaeon]